ncbi:MAG: Hpt domain-containing protein [Candidatus Competibacteraceae bacterium]
MMISRRVADNPLVALKDDLLLALRRIQLDLDDYRDHPAEIGPLETMVDAIDQVRVPLAVLDHQQAVALLDVMRETALALTRGELQSLDITVLQRAADQLTGYLGACLSPGNRRRPDAELSRAAEALRRARRQSGVANTGNTVQAAAEESTMGSHAIMEVLRRLQQAIVRLEPAADQPQPWEVLRNDLRILYWMLAERDCSRPAYAIGRLDRIVEALAAGAAESYGSLVSGVCAEILAQLSYGLESAEGGLPSSMVLRRTEDHLAQLDMLLNMSALTETAIAAALVKPPSTPPTPLAVMSDFGLNLSEGPAPASLMPKPEAKHRESTSATWDETSTFDWPELNIQWPEPEPAAVPVSSVEPGMSIAEIAPESGLEPGTLDGDEMAIAARLIPLIGLVDADPEFVEVFIEEARDVLATVREQLGLWREDLTDRTALTTIRRAFHTLKGSGRMVGATVIGDFAWEFESLLNQVLEGSLAACPAIADTMAAAVAGLAPLVGETPLRGGELEALPALVAQARALLQAGPKSEPESAPAKSPRPTLAVAPGIDPEFVEVFLEEAHGELVTIQAQQALWRKNLADRQAMTVIRRAFHTLKGSGRVVGATVIGDFAWYFENLLNQALNGALVASLSMVDLVEEAALALEPLLGVAPVVADETLDTLAQLTARVDELLQAAPAHGIPVSLEPLKMLEHVALPLAETGPPADLAPAERLVVDPELVQVFQYEAAEILDASDAILQQLRTDPDNTGLLNDLRRGMHTLKGSSRMTGIMVVGDLAHAAESVLDALGKSTGQATSTVLDTLQNTLDHLNRMLAKAAGGISPPAAIELIGELHRLADTIVKGEPQGALPPTPSMAGKPVAVALPPEPRSFRAMTELDQELAQIFQTEASEILDSSDVILQRLRSDPDNVELLNDLRREMHTLKGSSRMAGFMVVGDLAHAAESVLDALSKETLKVSPQVLEPVQRTLDRLHQLLAGLRDGIPPSAQQDLINVLHGLISGKPVEPIQSPVVPTTLAVVPVAKPGERLAGKPAPVGVPTDAIRVSAALLNTLVNQMGESSIFRARIGQGVSSMGENLSDMEQTIARLRRHVNHLATQAEARIQSRHDQGPKGHQLDFDPLELDRFTELQQLSRSLMEIAEDLGSVGNALGEHTRDITTLLDQQGKVNKEIQQGLMRTGMVRFGSIIPRLRRVVRQASQDMGKRAELLVDGEAAEVDRTVLENMVAPLEHMLRNSLAHGIELPEQRRATGKPDIGTITLSLRREGAELVLELNDDGAGIDFAAIRVKGEEKGLLLPGQPATKDELIGLLLRPGFSTASAVTQVSGRGVGMDVVNEAIRSMRGALLIQSESGRGTHFIVRLPFSLAVTQALLVQSGDATFAIPLLSIERVTRIKETEFKAYLSGEQVQYQYGNRNYPIHSLGILVGGEHVLPFDEAKDRRPPTLLFCSAEASAALQVDAVQSNQEIIVKPVGPQFNGVPGISGATVLGDGRVVVVLELAALVRNIGSQRQKQTESRALRAARQETRQEKLTIMVIDDSITMRRVTARILERHNIQAITAKDGLDAVAMLQTHVPDLAILDIEMPRMDGFEVVAHVRNQPSLRHLPIIMVTSRGGEKHRERAIKLGVNDYLTKPYQEEQLMLSIRKILGERALELIT